MKLALGHVNIEAGTQQGTPIISGKDLLLRQLKRLTRLFPKQYLKGMRLEKARKLTQNPFLKF